MVIKYFDRTTQTNVGIQVESDCVEVQLPDAEGRQAININVNTDAIVVDTQKGERVAMYEHTDLLANFYAEKGDE